MGRLCGEAGGGGRPDDGGMLAQALAENERFEIFIPIAVLASQPAGPRRPKPGAPVSTPLRWEEVNESLDPAAFTMAAVRQRVEREGDLFAGVLTTKQSLSAALKTLR